MIQRIQTLFLLGVITMLLLAGFSSYLFDYMTEDATYQFSGYGIAKYGADGKLLEMKSIPLYIITVVIALFAAVVMMSYKKISKQFSYSKLLWGAYLLSIIGVVTWNYLIAPKQIEGEALQNNYGAAFYFLVIGLPLTHLAFINIGKDKKKIDSLNRLR